MTWRQLSMLIGQMSLTGYGAHALATHQLSDAVGMAIAAGIVTLGIIGGLGETGARQIVAGIGAWRGTRPAAPAAPRAEPAITEDPDPRAPR